MSVRKLRIWVPSQTISFWVLQLLTQEKFSVFSMSASGELW